MSGAPDANDLVIAGKPLAADGVELGEAASAVDLGERPTIAVTTEEGEVNAQATAALARDRTLFQRSGAIVRVNLGDEDEAPAIGTVPEAIVQERLAVHARWIKRQARTTKTGEVEWIEAPVHPPSWCVKAVSARGRWAGMRPLRGVVETAVLRPDGTVLSAPGYDARSGLLMVASSGGPPVPDRPTREDVDAALALLEDVVCDVCWARPAHLSTWLAAVLTPLARAAFDGPAPLFLFEATVPGSGKGLALDCAIRIATGRAASFESFTTDENELKKQIVTWASSGRSIVVFDEVASRLDGAALRSVLTAPVIAGRLLGQSREWVGKNVITWYATGNNIAIGPEMFRRILPARLVSPVENPEKRTGFRHADLRGYVTRRSAELRSAALTILRAYCVAGRPAAGLSAMGSFEGWSALVRGAIVWVGREDPATAIDALKETDDRGPKLRALAGLWMKLQTQLGTHDRGCTAKQAIDHAVKGGDPGPLPELRELLLDIASDKSGQVSTKALGYLLRALNERILLTDQGEVMFTSPGTDRVGTKLWRATVLAAGDAGDAGDDPNARTRATSPTPSGPSPAIAKKDPLHHQHHLQGSDDPWADDEGAF